MKVVVLILLSLALVSDVEALAVASDFIEKNTLEVIEETSTTYGIRLQNPESHEVRVAVTYNDDFMKAIDFKEEYTLQPKSSLSIVFNVTAPKYRDIDVVYDLAYTVHQLEAVGGGGVGFSPKISKLVKLRVIKDPNKLYIDDFYKYIPHVAVLSAVIFFLLRKEFSGKKFRRNKGFNPGKNKIFKNRKIIKWKH